MSHSDQKNKVSLRALLNEERIFQEGIRYASYDEVLDRIESYFDFCEDSGKPPTIVGISLYLGFPSREDLIDFIKTTQDKNMYKVFRVAVSLIELEYESMLHRPRMAAQAGFALKNLGWRDSVDLDGKMSVGLKEIEVHIVRQDREKDVSDTKNIDNREVRAIPGTVQV